MVTKPGTDNIKVWWAAAENFDVVQQIGNVHLPEPILRRKIAWQEVIVAKIDQAYAGYLLFDYLWSLVPFISTIWVVATYRQQGVGKAMLRFAEAELRDRGHRALYSSSQLDEPPPQAWHRQVGFEECGIINGINDGIGEVFFRKWIDERN